MKKIISVVVAICIFSSMCVISFASDVSKDSAYYNLLTGSNLSASYLPEDFVQVEDPLKDYVPSSMDFLVETTVTRSSTISVNVTQPCDQTWRAKYPDNWMWQAYRVVKQSDALLEDVCGVQFISHSQKIWTRNTTDYADQLNEAVNEFGLGEADMMMAFSAYLPGGVMGAAYRNTPYCIIYDYGYDANWGVAEHETGHCYGLLDYCTGKESDNCCSNACIMNGGHKNKICSYCRPKLVAAKNKY